ncbi:DNA integrity scanning protein DisA, partial [Candidatus Bipolaricaulota bacterium]|nr:DNA integrity scanning protein DisA [Candidatus Bipolaricaulota bacterium]
VVNPITTIGQMLTLKKEINRMFLELGEEKTLPSRQLNNMISGIEEDMEFIIKDFCRDLEGDVDDLVAEVIELCSETTPSTKKLMALLGYEEEHLDEFLSSRGYRILHKIPRLPHVVIERIVDRFGTLENILQARRDDLQDVKGVAETRSNTIKAGLQRLENRITIMEDLES